MTRSIALSLLAQGNNGNEILSILDAIATEEAEQSTVDVIEFWCYNLLRCSAVMREAPQLLFGSYSWFGSCGADAVMGGGARDGGGYKKL